MGAIDSGEAMKSIPFFCELLNDSSIICIWLRAKKGIGWIGTDQLGRFKETTNPRTAISERSGDLVEPLMKN